MHKLIFFIAALLILGGTACRSSKLMEQTNSLSNETKAAFAPDSRTAVYAINTAVLDKAILLEGETNIPEAKKALLLKLEQAHIPFIDSIQVLPNPDLAKTRGVVNLSVANLRSKPTVSAGLETQVLLGMPLRILKQEGSWFLVQTPEKYIKWMNGGAFKLMSNSEFDSWRKAQKVMFTTGLGFAYTTPDLNSQIVTDLIAGNILQTINFDGDFTKVALPDGTFAFVLSEKLMNYDDWIESRDLTDDNIEKTAFTYMGAPYVWGGTSGKGLDCSGFTKNVFLLNGIVLPRDASQQVNVGKVIQIDDSLSQLKKGDLLFFGRKANGVKKERVSHVGIYLGNGKFIHAGAPKAKVAVESLWHNDPSFAKKRLASLLHVKRIIGFVGEYGIEVIDY